MSVERGQEIADSLMHAGVKGMKWGQRKTNREAAKDAKEYTKAKMYFGEGAGVRRRLINNSVKSKMKDPAYKAAFDKHVSNTDMSRRASQARGTRKRTDTTNGIKKTARGIGHIARGNSQYASLAAAGIFTAAVAAHKSGVDKILLNKGKQTLSAAMNSPVYKMARSRMGI